MRRIAVLLAVGSGCVLLTCTAWHASAADLYVTTTADTLDGTCDSHCSLREAVMAANFDTLSHDTIHLQAARYELSINGVDENFNTTGDLDLRSDMTIVGKGPGLTIIDAKLIDRVLDVTIGGVDITIRGVTITGGWLASPPTLYGSGIRIFASSSNIVIQTCVLEGNYAYSAVTTAGGALFVQGADVDIFDTIIRSNSATEGAAIFTQDAAANVTLERCAVYDNQVFGGHGVIDNTLGTMVIYTSTVSSNSTGSGNAGVRNYYGTMLIAHSTLTGNTGAEVVAGSGGLVTLMGTLVDGHCDVESPSAIDTDWYNLESPGDTCALDLFYDKYNVADPMIGSLSFNGGPTPTHLPEPLSPVVDTSFSATAICSGPDQRWIDRPWDGEADPDRTPECDVGAVERVPGMVFFECFECGYTTPWSSSYP